MATDEKKFYFPEQIENCRKNIRDCFKRSQIALQMRENILLSQVDEIEKEYNCKTKEMNQLVKVLDRNRSFTSETLRDNKLKETFEQICSVIDNKMSEFSSDTDTSIDFEWVTLFENGIEHIGSVKLNGLTIVTPSSTFPPHVKPVVPNYKNKSLPTTYCCKRSSNQKSPGELYSPRSIAIHYKTENIYIADLGNDRVQVFSCSGDYDFMFSEKMNKPVGICVSKNKVFVTQNGGNCINMYDLEGKLIESVGSEGNGEVQFKFPLGLDVSDINNNIYVCDCRNHRIQILTEDLKYNSMFEITMLKYPRDVKVTRDRVLVLDENDPCIFVFNSDHILTNRLITRGEGKQTNNPCCFDLDREYNIIMSDCLNHCVYVFNQEGEQIHKFGMKGQGIEEMYRPYGIALDNMGHIVVVSEKKSNCLQFF